MDGHGTTWRRNIAENFNRLSRVHERYRQTDDRQTDGRTIAYSEHELEFTFAICHRPPVCVSSVTFVHPTQAIEIFGNVSTPCGTMAIHDLCVKILRRSSQRNPFVWGVKPKRGSKNIAILDFSKAISETMQDMI